MLAPPEQRRSQDDAMVSYFYQRPTNAADYRNHMKHGRWALDDDSILEVRHSEQGDMESELPPPFTMKGNHIHPPLEISSSAKKLWGVEDNTKTDESKGIFLGNQWRDWSTGHPSDHAVSQPIMMQQRRSGSYPGGDAATVLSPRSSEAGGLGVKMVEYVLGSSPTTKDLDARMVRLSLNGLQNHGDEDKCKKDPQASHYDPGKEQDIASAQSNGIMQNGLDDDKSFIRSHGSRQPSPSEDDNIGKMMPQAVSASGMLPHVAIMHKSTEELMAAAAHASAVAAAAAVHHQQQLQQQQQQQQHPGPGPHHLPSHFPGMGGHLGPGPGGPMMGNPHQPAGFDSPHPMEPVAIDPLAPFDYPGNQIMPSMDSPNILDYNNQMYQRSQQGQQHQQSLAMLAQQQYALATPQQQQQQLSMGPAPFTSNSYMINAQDPYSQVGPVIPGPPVVPPYYSTMTPWGMYAANMMQQGPGTGGPGPNTSQANSSGQNPAGPMGQQSVAMAAAAAMLRGASGPQPSRPLTPQTSGGPGLGSGNNSGPPGHPSNAGPPDGPGNPGNLPPGQYPMLAPTYYDQNGMMVGGRGMNAPMRLVSPAPVLMGNQPGVPTSSGQNSLYPSTSSSFPGLPGGASSSLGMAAAAVAASSNGMGFNPAAAAAAVAAAAAQQSTYGNNLLGTLGSSSMGALGGVVGLGNAGNGGQQRRDSFERRDVNPNLAGLDFARSLPKGPFYSALGTVTASPGPLGMLPSSSTPPPSLGGSSNNLSLGALMSGNRIISAAPGAEAKFRNGTLAANGVFGSSNSLFSNRTLQRNSSVEKSTGRSRLLEDFRNNRYPNLQLRDLANHIVEFSQDQHGSRFIQQKLERATPAEKQMVFNEILSAAYSLMTDVFGNYVIQKFFEFGNLDQKQTLAQRVRGHVLPLALQMYGCRVIQKALESIPPDQQKDVVKELDGHVLKCVKDQNGNHVVQKCIECVDPGNLQFIINAFQGQVFALSTHPYGCRVIQRILEHCTPEQTSPILEELHQHTENLVQDQYGNYVIQHVLEHGRSEDKSKIVSVVRGKVLQLSQHKFASNVVEKCITHATRAERAMLIDEVCSYNDGPHSALYTMMKDQFANYVVQKMIDVAEPAQRKLLMHKIRPHVATLRKYTYGKHILAKLEKHLMKNNADLGPIGPPPPTNGSL